jgi:hypothetical protein
VVLLSVGAAEHSGGLAREQTGAVHGAAVRHPEGAVAIAGGLQALPAGDCGPSVPGPHGIGPPTFYLPFAGTFGLCALPVSHCI